MQVDYEELKTIVEGDPWLYTTSELTAIIGVSDKVRQNGKVKKLIG